MYISTDFPQNNFDAEYNEPPPSPPQNKQFENDSLTRTPNTITATNDEETINTPTQNVIIKTENVTPMLNYEAMNTPTIQQELNKYGLKSLKRPRGVQILKYIYEATHPLVSVQGENERMSDEDMKVVKSRRIGDANVGLEGNVSQKEMCHSWERDEGAVRVVGDLLVEK